MCDTCGCGDPELVAIDLHERILAGNDRTAAHNREHFRAMGVAAINLMGSPGAGKTAVLEATSRALHAQRLGALAGDLATEHDANRLRAAGIVAKSITTGSACHLDAAMVHRALHDFPWRTLDYLFIENVGNLVCPAVYDLGQAVNVVALAVTEGEDKPLKYPVMFRKADLVLVTKIDLLPYLPGVRMEAIADALGAGHAASGLPSDLRPYRRWHAGLAHVADTGAASRQVWRSGRNRSRDNSRPSGRRDVASRAMSPELEAIVSADEEGRARLEAAEAAAQASVRAAAEARERQRQERYEALRKATDDEERRIREAADHAVANRQAIRSRYRETRRRAAESALARAAEVYASIVTNGPSEMPK